MDRRYENPVTGQWREVSERPSAASGCPSVRRGRASFGGTQLPLIGSVSGQDNDHREGSQLVWHRRLRWIAQRYAQARKPAVARQRGHRPHALRHAWASLGNERPSPQSREMIISHLDGRPASPPATTTIDWSSDRAQKGGYPHFMLKEIHEQPRAVADTLRGRLKPETGDADLDGFTPDLSKLRRVVLIACGTSYHACLVGKFLIESLARLPCE